MDASKYTPMMQHYLQLKEENQDAILMYRLGDFYEMFFEDAKTASRELDLVLTGRAGGNNQKVPMCGIPYHAVNNYIPRLVKAGYKVAICEQLSDPKASKGLVDRGIIKIITPGTYIEDQVNRKTSNYLAVLSVSGYEAALIFCELSTGELRYEICDRSLSAIRRLLNEMQVLEVVVDRGLSRSWMDGLENPDSWVVSAQKGMELELEDEKLLPSSDPLLRQALSLLMGYLQKTQKHHADHLSPMTLLHPANTMIMDPETKNHLELTRTFSSYGKAVSLWEMMDLCRSSMGSRLLKSWIEAPLVVQTEIERRQEAVQTLLDQFLLREQLKDHLSFIYDMERLASRISYGTASPRDVLQLTSSLAHARPVLELAVQLESYPELASVPDCQDLYEEIKNAIVDEPPLTLKDGNVIAPGYNETLDELRRLADASQDAILAMENEEKERTGIKSLKIGYNRVFGYYIEVRHANKDLVKPEYGYTPKQTLANATRYITPQLKELEDKILSAQEQKISLEQELFHQLTGTIKSRLDDLHVLARSLALIDVLYSLAELANKKGYVRPVFTKDHQIEIQEGRHPILDQKLSSFVSNDWTMNEADHIQLITGPNMGGKSTYLRQNALLVIMAQTGSYIPAKKAILPIFDRIFTRIGASDDILTGKSTFMVEMMEANNALRYATKNSLILFDEIGRGTATYDGMSIAQAMLEYIDEAIGAKTLFSTHYHELTELEDNHPGIHNVHVDVKEKKEEIQFRYRVIDGKADKSYGINVARLAHLPESVLSRARTLLEHYENQNQEQGYQPNLFVMDSVNPAKSRLMEKLDTIDVDAMSPREALDCLYHLKQLAQLAEKE